MNNTELYTKIEKLCKKYNLGSLTASPKIVTGGLLHTMYCVKTSNSKYAVKCLNKLIVKRPGVLELIKNSEKIAKDFKTIIPVILAKVYNGQSILEIENEYFMVFEWVEAESIFSPDIKEKHCKIIGNILGKIHTHKNIVAGIKIEIGEYKLFNFDKYLQLGIELDKEWAEEFSKIVDLIKFINHSICKNNAFLSKNIVLSHRDMDPKNVLWENNNPYIIDWESAGYVNPYQELLEMLNYWCSNDKNKFITFYNSYKNYNKCLNVNWDIIILSVYYGKLAWLDYSLKRSLGIEAYSEEEMKLGTNQVLHTIKDIQQYYKSEYLIKRWLSN